jgi:anti-anti-sigma factor
MNSNIKIVQPSGILNNALAADLCREVESVFQAGFQVVLVDLQQVPFIDSSGLGGLVNAFKASRAAGGKLVLCSVCEQGRMLFEITGMDQIFEIFLNQHEFANSFMQAV